jgi:uncharacterized repeat protein (TIGR01451 family)
MKNPSRNKISTLLVIVITLILAVIAIITALRLYQLRSNPVAPNVPQTEPFAATPKGCPAIAFNIQETPGLTCRSETCWSNDSRNSSSSYYLVKQILAGGEVIPGQTLVFAITYENTGKGTATSSVVSDTLSDKFEFVDADPGCTYNSISRKVTCNIGSVVTNGKSQKAIRVKVSKSATVGTLSNSATMTSSGSDNSTCQISLNIKSSPTSTPTSASSSTPTSTPKTPTPTPTSPSYTSTPGPTSTSSTAPITKISPTPTGEPTLPAAGISYPTIIGTVVGFILIATSFLLAL